MKDSWLADIKMFPIYYIVWEKPLKCEGSLVSGGNTWKHAELQSYPGSDGFFPVRCDVERGLIGVPHYLDPNVGQEQRETLTLIATQGYYLVPSESHTSHSKIKFT